LAKSIVITGCSSGFGWHTTLHLLRRGWRVFATVRREPDRQSLLDEAASAGPAGNLSVLLCDVTDAGQVAAMAQQVLQSAPKLDALLNNAGTSFGGPLELLPLDDLRAQLELNVIAPLAVSRALLPGLKAARGRLINVSSVSGRIAYPGNGAYCASKFALEAMSDVLRVELAHFGVQVVVIEAGSSATGIWRTSVERTLDGYRQRQADLGAYAPFIENLRQAMLKKSTTGFPPQLFAGTVSEALEARTPRTRYVIPRRARWKIALRQLVPDRVWDRAARRALNW
jgi:NAD(P)-dependent dehydrogenase (short-subunit alcohol dehydrogenase family)